MFIKVNVFYDRGNDYIIGLAENENGSKIFFEPALSTSVLMIRGLYSKWKQPITFFFNHTSFIADSMKNVLLLLIPLLKEIGLKVCILTADMGSNNLVLAITIERPYFFVGEQKVMYIFDVPHIFKAIRNNLIKYDCAYENKKIHGIF